MKTSKIIFLIIFVTVLSLVYVWQQAKVIELAYEKQKKIKLCRALLDRNTFLRYNLNTLESFGNLTKNLREFDLDYEMPSFTQIVDLRSTNEKNKLKLASSIRQEKIILSLFSPRSQAEAQTK